MMTKFSSDHSVFEYKQFLFPGSGLYIYKFLVRWNPLSHSKAPSREWTVRIWLYSTGEGTEELNHSLAGEIYGFTPISQTLVIPADPVSPQPA